MRSILDNISKRLFLIVTCSMMFLSLNVSAAVSPMEMMASAKVWVVLVILVWEYLIGKTKLVKANSTVEMVENIFKMVFGITKDDLKV